MIFISRNLKTDSPLLSWGRTAGVEVKGISLLQFKAVPFDAPGDTDWWFFYSSRAVQYAGPIPSGVKTAAMGGGTATALLRSAAPVDFCGSGTPEDVADEFLAVSAGRRVFFPRARQSRLSVQTVMSDRVTVLDAVCYENQPAPPEAPITARTYIFTSPLNVSAYLDHYALPVDAKVLAIGPSTGSELQRRGIACRWPDVPSEGALLDLL
ncbi:MAG: uroporphyrinogen-III synthase [Lewinella sp.]